MAEKEIIQMQNNDYDELLLRAVAVIEKTRTDVARHIAIAVSNTYWEIGKLLYEKKLESKHGSQVVKRQMQKCNKPLHFCILFACRTGEVCQRGVPQRI